MGGEVAEGAVARFGVVFPTTEIGAERADVDALAAAAQAAGLDYVTIYDHVVGVDPAAHPGWSGHYDVENPFHEPLTTLAYLAGRTDLELMTGVLVLPQRQAVLVAKQAAQLALLTGDRFLLGVGTGWNEFEYRALGLPFDGRGRRFDQQIDVMRDLWRERVVTRADEHHDLDGVGMAPRPGGGRIPLWFGAGASGAGLRRIGRVGDGWITREQPGAAVTRAMAEIADAARAAGRDPAAIGLQGMVQAGAGATTRDLVDQARAWWRLGASRISFSGMRAGRSPGEHIGFVDSLAGVLEELRKAL